MRANDMDRGLTIEYLRQYLAYDPLTGSFTWTAAMRRSQRGKVAGCAHWPGYVKIKIKEKLYFAHRLAWFYVHGDWPADLIDHIDGNKANNAIANLRVATAAQNAARRKTTRKLAPSRGLAPHGPGFVARIHHGGKRHYLGYFATAEAAAAAYEAKALEIHGEFRHVEQLTDMDAVVADAVKRSPHRDWLLVATPGFAGAN